MTASSRTPNAPRPGPERRGTSRSSADATRKSERGPEAKADAVWPAPVVPVVEDQGLVDASAEDQLVGGAPSSLGFASPLAPTVEPETVVRHPNVPRPPAAEPEQRSKRGRRKRDRAPADRGPAAGHQRSRVGAYVAGGPAVVRSRRGRCRLGAGQLCAQLAHDLRHQVDVLGPCPPVDERRAERDAAAVGRGAEEHAPVGQGRLADPTVQIVELGPVDRSRRGGSGSTRCSAAPRPAAPGRARRRRSPSGPAPDRDRAPRSPGAPRGRTRGASPTPGRSAHGATSRVPGSRSSAAARRCRAGTARPSRRRPAAAPGRARTRTRSRRARSATCGRRRSPSRRARPPRPGAWSAATARRTARTRRPRGTRRRSAPRDRPCRRADRSRPRSPRRRCR